MIYIKKCPQCQTDFKTCLNYDICSFCWYDNNWGKKTINYLRKAVGSVNNNFFTRS